MNEKQEHEENKQEVTPFEVGNPGKSKLKNQLRESLKNKQNVSEYKTEEGISHK
jgi:hypothetical protein